MAKTKVTIEDEVKTDNGVSKDGKPWTERYQEAFLHNGGRFPKSCKVTLYDNARPYRGGDYETEQELEISDYGRLQVKRELALTPLPAPAK